MNDLLRRRIEHDFDPSQLGTVDRLMDEAAALSGGQDNERIQGACVLWAEGDVARLEEIIGLLRIDFRDVLMRVGLETEDWKRLLDTRLASLRTMKAEANDRPETNEATEHP